MVEAAIRELPGLRRIEMVKLDDGTWVDVVLWEGRASSQNGLQNGPDVPVIGEWLATNYEDVEMVKDDPRPRDRSGAGELTTLAAVENPALDAPRRKGAIRITDVPADHSRASGRRRSRPIPS